MPKVVNRSGRRLAIDPKLLPAGVIHWTEAKDHINEPVSIYGEVRSTYFDWKNYEQLITVYQAGDANPGPTFIEVGEKYPSQALVKIVIWGQHRVRFPKPPDIAYRDKTIVFTGKPYVYNGIVTVSITGPASIRIVDPIDGLYDVPYSDTDSDTDSLEPDDYEEEDFDYDDLGATEYSPRRYDPWADPIAIAFHEYYEYEPMAEYEDDPWSYVYGP